MEKNQSNVQSEIIQKEKDYWQSMVSQDLNTALRLTDFPCLVAGPHGLKLVEREAYKQMFESHKEEMRSFEIVGKPEVRLLGPDTAVIAYQVRSTMLIGGEEKVFEAVDTSTWIRRDGQWACAMHSEALLDKEASKEKAA